MTQADLAIGAAGASAFERAALGLPSILVTLADNQRGICRLMVKAGAAANGGDLGGALASQLHDQVTHLLSDGLARQRMAQAASALVDGQGAARVAEHFS